MRPVGLGASCVVCGERRRQNLKSIELLGAWLPICHNCGACATALAPMPRTIAGVREALQRERRVIERRIGYDDRRAFRVNRRTGERRRDKELNNGLPHSVVSGEVDEMLPSVDDDMIIEITDLPDELIAASGEGGEGGERGEAGELTRIIELVAEPG